MYRGSFDVYYCVSVVLAENLKWDEFRPVWPFSLRLVIESVIYTKYKICNAPLC